MVTDQLLYVERHTRLKHILVDAEAARTLAATYNLQEDSVRGRLSRADNHANRTAVMQALALQVPDVSPAVARQEAVIERSNEEWIRANGWKTRRLVFMSDIHLGQPRWDAYQLALEICDYWRPDFITAQNDALDNKGFGRWIEDRSVRGQQWTSDDMNLRELERWHYANIGGLAKRGLPALAGNHDNWYFKYLRENSPQTAESTIAAYMEDLEKQGVLLFTRGYTENHLLLSPGVVVWHGQFTNKNVRTLAKNNLEYFLHVYGDGIIRSVVAGHTHRPYEEHGVNIGYPGVRFVSNGALTDYTPYLKRNPHAHGLGITLIEYDPLSRDHEITLVRFKEQHSRLVAKLEGKVFNVPLNKGHRDDYR